MEKWFFITGSIPPLLLGTVHLVYTFLDERRPEKLTPKSKTLLKAMQEDTLRLTHETTMWKAWLGFNYSHSIGPICIGLLYIYMASTQHAVFTQLTPLVIAAPILTGCYVVLAKRYWFSHPFIGMLISTILMGVGAALILTA